MMEPDGNGAWNLKYDDNILGLARLPCLQRLQFSSCQPADGLSAWYFATLVSTLAKECTHVVCILGSQLPSEIMAKFDKKRLA